MIVLASASPRRQELMKLITGQFAVEPSDIDESITEPVEVEKIPEYLAVKKAAHIAAAHPGETVIGCDTGVFIDGIMLGKPKSDDDAFDMLKLLEGRTHKVITGCAIIKGSKIESFSQITEVEFYPLSDAEIREYIATGEPSDKAGAYGIQEKGALLVKGIKGDYFNVVGLPVAELNKRLKEI